MKRIKRAHWSRKGLKRSLQDGWRKFDQRDALNEGTRLLAVRSFQPPRIEPGPYLVFEESACD
jgi:hypothetical protein